MDVSCIDVRFSLIFFSGKWHWLWERNVWLGRQYFKQRNCQPTILGVSFVLEASILVGLFCFLPSTALLPAPTSTSTNSYGTRWFLLWLVEARKREAADNRDATLFLIARARQNAKARVSYMYSNTYVSFCRYESIIPYFYSVLPTSIYLTRGDTMFFSKLLLL